MAGGTAMLSLVGCIGGGPEDSGPQERQYTLTIAASDETIEMQVTPAGEVADVIQVYVGDTVEFTILNEADDPVGFHNHANDAEVMIEPGREHVMTFEATEAMTGRHEIEGWLAAGNQGHADDEEDHGEHGESTTTLAIIEVRPQGS